MGKIAALTTMMPSYMCFPYPATITFAIRIHFRLIRLVDFESNVGHYEEIQVICLKGIKMNHTSIPWVASNDILVTFSYLSTTLFWWLMPLSTIFQLYRGGQIY